MRAAKNFGNTLLFVFVLSGCAGSGGDSAAVDDVDPSATVDGGNTEAEQQSDVVQPDPPAQNPDNQNPDSQNPDDQSSDLPDQTGEDTDTDQSTDVDNANDTPADMPDDTDSQDNADETSDQIDEPDPVLIPSGQFDEAGVQLLVPLPVPEMVAVAAGCFDMGSPQDEPLRSTTEGPQLNVCVSEFSLGSYEVTFAQYDAFAMATSRDLPDSNGFGRGDRPVINVIWDDATDYVSWLSEQTGRSFRLPTEAEWEYAARAGTQTPFNTGQTITSAEANFNDVVSYNGSAINGNLQQTLPVGSFSPNAFRLHDMHGNVQEWTCSTFIGDYRSSAAPQMCDSSEGGVRVLRGGNWRSTARNVRSAWRNSLFTSFVSNGIGFRVLEQ